MGRGRWWPGWRVSSAIRSRATGARGAGAGREAFELRPGRRCTPFHSDARRPCSPSPLHSIATLAPRLARPSLSSTPPHRLSSFFANTITLSFPHARATHTTTHHQQQQQQHHQHPTVSPTPSHPEPNERPRNSLTASKGTAHRPAERGPEARARRRLRAAGHGRHRNHGRPAERVASPELGGVEQTPLMVTLHGVAPLRMLLRAPVDESAGPCSHGTARHASRRRVLPRARP